VIKFSTLFVADLFGNSAHPDDQNVNPNPNGLTEGDVVAIDHKSRTGYLRKIEGPNGWVESNVKKASGWYSLTALSLASE